MEWRAVVYPGIKENRYLCDENGNIKSIYHHGKIMKTHLDKGYKIISLVFREGKHKNVPVHRIVCYTFNGYPPKDMAEPSVNHKDYNTLNNNFSNLEWMEWKENARMRKNLPSCERSGHATMDNKTARKIIFELANSDINENEIAQKYGINSQVVSQIATGKTWRELSEPYLDDIFEHNRHRKTKMAITLFGITKSKAEWCRIFCICDDTVLKRERELGCTTESAIITPKMTSHEWKNGGYSHEECEKRFKEVMNNEKDNRKEF